MASPVGGLVHAFCRMVPVPLDPKRRCGQGVDKPISDPLRDTSLTLGTSPYSFTPSQQPGSTGNPTKTNPRTR